MIVVRETQIGCCDVSRNVDDCFECQSPMAAPIRIAMRSVETETKGLIHYSSPFCLLSRCLSKEIELGNCLRSIGISILRYDFTHGNSFEYHGSYLGKGVDVSRPFEFVRIFPRNSCQNDRGFGAF